MNNRKNWEDTMCGVISPEYFWEKFASGLNAKLTDTPDWESKYTSDKEWTEFITEFLVNLGEELEFRRADEISKEHYRIDVSYYINTGNPKTKEFGLRNHAWDMEVAIEHENDGSNWLDEFVKLIHVSCGLKVIISYSPNEIEEKLGYARSIYRDRKYRLPNDRWLFIFGPSYNNYKCPDTRSDFVAYSLDGQRLADRPVLRGTGCRTESD